MPLRRKIINMGGSKGITLPLSWLEEHEKRTGQKVEAILLEVDNVITLTVPEKEDDRKAT